MAAPSSEPLTTTASACKNCTASATAASLSTGGLFWNLLGLFDELKTGLRKAFQTGVELSGMAIDTGRRLCILDRKASRSASRATTAIQD